MKKEEILNGLFIPTKRNIRKIDDELGNFENIHFVVSAWLKSNSEFKNLLDLIQKFDSDHERLGFKGRHDYTHKFNQEYYKAKNAWFQVVKLIENGKISQVNQNNVPRTWARLFNFLKNNNDWKLTDLLTGEIISKNDFNTGEVILHHIDRDKSNDKMNNLAIILNGNHGIITFAQQHYEKLTEFFEKLLKDNLKSIEEGIVPLSWKIPWRVLANKSGLKIHHNRYKRRGKLNKKLITLKKRIKEIKDWV